MNAKSTQKELQNRGMWLTIGQIDAMKEEQIKALLDATAQLPERKRGSSSSNTQWQIKRIPGSAKNAEWLTNSIQRDAKALGLNPDKAAYSTDAGGLTVRIGNRIFKAMASSKDYFLTEVKNPDQPAPKAD